MAALAAARRGLRVLVLEQTQAPGRKFSMLRRGQGSISHELISHEYFHGRHGRFAIDALGALDADALQALFNELGIELQLDDGLLRHGEKRGHDLARALTAAIEAAGGEIRCGVTVLGLSRKRTWAVATTVGQFSAKRVVLALGGPHFPQLGGSEDGLRIARSLGHSIEPHSPAVVGVRTREIWPFRLAGLWMECGVTLFSADKPLSEAKGLVLFTAGALVGPAIASISREVEPALALGKELKLSINFYPEQTQSEVATWFFRTLGQHTRKFAPDAMNDMLPRRLATELCRVAGVDPRWRCDRLDPDQRKRVEGLLTDTRLTITGTLGWRAAEATRGGVNVREVDPKSFESKTQKGLHIVGDLLDVDAPIAAMNVHFALASGWCAGSGL
ncbi:3-dehydro-bile acid delta(4,6)-reductase [Planctomycetaceae bacterium]|nr:3-dehydro-bile acid delta(4,6)-reductase [Planctomycetaceae bacterium]